MATNLPIPDEIRLVATVSAAVYKNGVQVVNDLFPEVRYN